ncbi:ADP-ribosylglycohydrolase family protein [Neofamilia massiliensis]|uniref:ADP-ribosylglycohydrolase family protein n=1 Tax=Neofamilia massiliensis TaxID=1673724 RepID=UPI0006BB5F27|nr:ADP-ribosylglycohydrolase family protein [Neofamilia massiliensis]
MKTLRDGLYGLAVGDALGVPVEFYERGTYKVTKMEGYGSWDQPPGTFSDDTSMTLATAYAIKEKKSIDLEAIMENFVDWLKDGKFTPDNNCFDVGRTTAKAIETYIETGSLEKSSQVDQRSNGNGSLMRILPLIFTDANDEDIAKVSALTHGHEISIEGCLIYVYIGREILKGRKLKDILKNLKVSETYERLKILDQLEEKDIKSTGYVVYSLEASLWCLLKSSSYEEAVLKAVNLGDDTDTIGAISGGLAGLIYGYESIPKNWIDTLRAKDLIEGAVFESL